MELFHRLTLHESEHPKPNTTPMKNIYLSFSLIVAQTLLSQKDYRIENIGKATSQLLIKGENIDNFKYAINIKSLYPNEDFSKFEDSPADVILNMLHGAELELPKAWNELERESSEHKIDKTSKYIFTYNHKMGVDNYIATSVIESQSKYYVFSYNLLQWGTDMYISRFYKKVIEFEAMEQIDSNPFVIIQEEMKKELNDIDENDSEEILIGPQN